MHRRQHFLVYILAVSLAFIFLAQTRASEGNIVRGMVYRLTTEGKKYPVADVAVRLVHDQRGRSSTSYSGRDGMYYLYNVPAGSYVLEVVVSKKQTLKFKVQVRNDPYTNIAPIQVQ